LSYNNLSSVTQTLASKIWNGIKEDKQLKKIIRSEEQISFVTPNDAKTSAQISIYLYSVNEYTSMRNQPQPQNTEDPRTLLYLNLRYLITPLTSNPITDQVVLGKIMQLFAEKPVLRGDDLQGSLKESGEELRVVLDAQSMDEVNKHWTALSAPYKLSVSYSVYPVQIKAEIKPQAELPVIKKPITASKKEIKSKKSA
jgi:hypothetical protein